MITIFRVFIIVATFQAISWTPQPCSQAEVFQTSFDTITAFEGNCPSCAHKVYSQAKANEWKLQGSPEWKVIIKVYKDSLEVEP